MIRKIGSIFLAVMMVFSVLGAGGIASVTADEDIDGQWVVPNEYSEEEDQEIELTLTESEIQNSDNVFTLELPDDEAIEVNSANLLVDNSDLEYDYDFSKQGLEIIVDQDPDYASGTATVTLSSLDLENEEYTTYVGDMMHMQGDDIIDGQTYEIVPTYEYEIQAFDADDTAADTTLTLYEQDADAEEEKGSVMEDVTTGEDGTAVFDPVPTDTNYIVEAQDRDGFEVEDRILGGDQYPDQTYDHFLQYDQIYTTTFEFMDTDGNTIESGMVDELDEDGSLVESYFAASEEGDEVVIEHTEEEGEELTYRVNAEEGGPYDSETVTFDQDDTNRTYEVTLAEEDADAVTNIDLVETDDGDDEETAGGGGVDVGDGLGTTTAIVVGLVVLISGFVVAVRD